MYHRPAGAAPLSDRDVPFGGATMRSALAITATLVLLTACGQQQTEGQTLQEFMGAPGADSAESEQRRREMEQRTAECMAEQGFEYTPRDPSDRPDVVTEHPREELGEDEFREQYGYGISTWRPEPDERPEPPEPPEDPNRQRLQDMEPAQREAYEKALHGERPDPEELRQADGPVEFEPGGCRAEAREAVMGDRQQLHQELQPELEELRQAVESDPRLVEAREGWVRCMRDRGRDVSERSDAQRLIHEAMSELREAAMPDDVDMPDPEEASREELESFEPPEPDFDEAALQELQQRELDMAADDHECAQEHDLEQVQQEVRAEHESEFIDEHRELLERLRDA